MCGKLYEDYIDVIGREQYENLVENRKKACRWVALLFAIFDLFLVFCDDVTHKNVEYEEKITVKSSRNQVSENLSLLEVTNYFFL